MSYRSSLGAVALAALSLLALPAFAAPSSDEPACLAPGQWARVDGGTPQAIAPTGLLTAMAQRDLVLLGEQHDDIDHHRWQLHTLAALHAQRPHMVIGFEMFPRRAQPVLDRWVAGELTEAEFLEQSEWDKVWSMPAQLYLPLFHFARLNRIPMLALNVDAALTRRIAEQGRAAVPESEREGVGQPAPAAADYLDFLRQVQAHHALARGKDAKGKAAEAALRNFVDSQLNWDRAMAEALLDGRLRHAAPDGKLPLAVGIMGSGHVRFGYGVAHQLHDLGQYSIGQLLPVAADVSCAALPPGLADAVFAVEGARRAPPPPPRLGVALEEQSDGVRLSEIQAGSLAERSGLRVGDIVVEAAGRAARRAFDVVAAVREQPPGTWLPLVVLRDSARVDVVVRFPPEK